MFDIVTEAIDPRVLEAAVRGDAFGGIVTFLGVVRERSSGGAAVSGLSYEAYEALAVEEFERIAREAVEQFGDVRLAIAHRIGKLAIGDVAVAVVAAARHRESAFDACEFAIDALKARAPIWKKEHYVHGDALWVSNES